MALIFPRIAQNYIKNGYFPTDLPTLARIASALDVGGETVRIIDPCCGEGGAAMHLVEHLQQCGSEVASFGVDVDEERAWHAKTVLGTVAHADVHDVRIADRSMGLLFLNPPYGDLVADGAKTSRVVNVTRNCSVVEPSICCRLVACWSWSCRSTPWMPSFRRSSPATSNGWKFSCQASKPSSNACCSV